MKIKLGELIVNFDRKRKPLSKVQREKMKGNIPYYGAACIFDYINQYIFDGEYILLGEDGTVLNDDGTPILQLTNGKFWPNNHTHVLKNNEKIVDFKYLYYLLKNTKFSEIVTGAVQQKISQGNMNNLIIDFDPDLNNQRKIANILSLFDSKIEINKQINKNLLEQALSAYKKIRRENSANGSLSDLIIQNKKSKIKVNEAKRMTGQIPFFTSGLSIFKVNRKIVDGKNIFLNTGGTADVKFFDGESSYSTDTWCIKGKDELTDYLYLLLKDMVKELDSVYFEGSALKHLQKKHLLEKKVFIPNYDDFKTELSFISTNLNKISINEKENAVLAEIRDALLPKLYSGKIDLNNL